MDTNFISRAEHDEFRRNMENEHHRQNHRLDALEKSVEQISQISSSVEKLALNMENMLKEQISQGKRLTVLENQDGEMWRKVVGYIVTAVIGVAIGFIANRLGLG